MLWIAIIITCLEFITLAKAKDFYQADANIIELSPSNFDDVVHRTNYTTLIEFYAPWCGYCQQIKGTMKNVGRVLDGLVQVAAVNCDESINKNLCAQHRVSGFPTLMVFRPPKVNLDIPYNERVGSSYHASELYSGERQLKPIVDFALSRVKNYVKKLNKIERLTEAVTSGRSQFAMVLFSKKDKVPTVYRSIAVDWLGVLDAYLIWNRKLDSISNIDIEKLPRISAFLQEVKSKADGDNSLLVVFDRENDNYQVYEGDSFNKTEVAKFLVAFGSANEGPYTRRDKFLSSLKSISKKQKKAPRKGKKASVIDQDEL